MVRRDVEKSREPTYTCNCRAKSQDDELCHICNQIDFEKVLSHNNLERLKGPKIVFNLRHIAGSNCPFCRFLRDCCHENTDLEDGDGFSKCWLKVGRVSPLFGTKIISEAPTLQIHVQHRIPGSDRACRLILPINYNPGVSGKHVRTDEINVSFIRDWLNICNELHALCRSNISHSNHDFVPGMYVIDCLPRTVVPSTLAARDYQHSATFRHSAP
jgi:hypothetical protein